MHIHAYFCSSLHIFAHCCSFVHINAHFCTFVHIYAHLCTFMNIPAHFCTLVYTYYAHFCSFLYISAHFCSFLRISKYECTFLHILAHSCTSMRISAHFCTLVHIHSHSSCTFVVHITVRPWRRIVTAAQPILAYLCHQQHVKSDQSIFFLISTINQCDACVFVMYACCSSSLADVHALGTWYKGKLVWKPGRQEQKQIMLQYSSRPSPTTIIFYLKDLLSKLFLSGAAAWTIFVAAWKDKAAHHSDRIWCAVVDQRLWHDVFKASSSSCKRSTNCRPDAISVKEAAAICSRPATSSGMMHATSACSCEVAN